MSNKKDTYLNVLVKVHGDTEFINPPDYALITLSRATAKRFITLMGVAKGLGFWDSSFQELIYSDFTPLYISSDLAEKLFEDLDDERFLKYDENHPLIYRLAGPLSSKVCSEHPDIDDPDVTVVDMPEVEVSSTDIRFRAYAWKSDNEKFFTDAVPTGLLENFLGNSLEDNER